MRLSDSNGIIGNKSDEIMRLEEQLRELSIELTAANTQTDALNQTVKEAQTGYSFRTPIDISFFKSYLKIN